MEGSAPATGSTRGSAGTARRGSPRTSSSSQATPEVRTSRSEPQPLSADAARLRAPRSTPVAKSPLTPDGFASLVETGSETDEEDYELGYWHEAYEKPQPNSLEKPYNYYSKLRGGKMYQALAHSGLTLIKVFIWFSNARLLDGKLLSATHLSLAFNALGVHALSLHEFEEMISLLCTRRMLREHTLRQRLADPRAMCVKRPSESADTYESDSVGAARLWPSSMPGEYDGYGDGDGEEDGEGDEDEEDEALDEEEFVAKGSRVSGRSRSAVGAASAVSAAHAASTAPVAGTKASGRLEQQSIRNASGGVGSQSKLSSAKSPTAKLKAGSRAVHTASTAPAAPAASTASTAHAARAASTAPAASTAHPARSATVSSAKQKSQSKA